MCTPSGCKDIGISKFEFQSFFVMIFIKPDKTPTALPPLPLFNTVSQLSQRSLIESRILHFKVDKINFN